MAASRQKSALAVLGSLVGIGALSLLAILLWPAHNPQPNTVDLPPTPSDADGNPALSGAQHRPSASAPDEFPVIPGDSWDINRFLAKKWRLTSGLEQQEWALGQVGHEVGHGQLGHKGKPRKSVYVPGTPRNTQEHRNTPEWEVE